MRVDMRVVSIISWHLYRHGQKTRAACAVTSISEALAGAGLSRTPAQVWRTLNTLRQSLPIDCDQAKPGGWRWTSPNPPSFNQPRNEISHVQSA